MKIKYAICPICNKEYPIITRKKPKTCGNLSCINEYQIKQMTKTQERPISDRMSKTWHNFGL
jgi:hypothetical protein